MAIFGFIIGVLLLLYVTLITLGAGYAVMALGTYTSKLDNAFYLAWCALVSAGWYFLALNAPFTVVAS